MNDARVPAALLLPVEHPPLHLLLCFDRGEIGERQKVVAFEVRAFIHELLTALIIYYPRHCMREKSQLGITGSTGTDQIRVEHPAASKAEDGIQACRKGVHFSVRG